MADYPDPIDLPEGYNNLVPDGGAELPVDESIPEIVVPFTEYRPPSTPSFDLISTNLATNPNLELNATSWASANGALYTFARDTSAPISGTASAMTTRTASTPNSAAGVVVVSPHPCVAGVPITFGIDVKSELAGRQLLLQYQWRTAGGTYISSSTNTVAIPSMNAGEVYRGVVTATPPATAALCDVVASVFTVDGSNATTGERVWFDNLSVESGTTEGTYFDGSTPDTDFDFYDWAGTPNASASRYYQPSQPPPSPLDLVVTRTPDTVHNGVAAFRIDKTVSVDRSFNIGVQIDLDQLDVGLLCVVDYWLYLPDGSGADPAAGTLGLQPMPEVLDMTLSGPENIDDIDRRGLSITMRSDPPLAEDTWLHQQITFYPTRSNHMFRLVITYNDVYAGPQLFYLDDLVVVQDESFGRYKPPPPPVVIAPAAPPVVIKYPTPLVFCGTDPRSRITPIMLVSGTSLFSDARAYWYIEGYHPDGSPRKVYPPETIEQFNAEYTSYDDIVSATPRSSVSPARTGTTTSQRCLSSTSSRCPSKRATSRSWTSTLRWTLGSSTR